MHKLSDFDYSLPESLIAQVPLARRDASRLLVLDRKKKTIEHRRFLDISGFLRPGDLLVLNDTKVIPARLFGRRSTGGRVEVFLLGSVNGSNGKGAVSRRYRALIKPLARLKENEEIFFSDGFSCRLVDPKAKIVEFQDDRVAERIKEQGMLPLPPYIRRPPGPLDERRYQTVFAKKEGAVAAPTAGLHFTKRLLEKISGIGCRVAYLTLHVNYATFSPVRSADIRQHKFQKEYFEILVEAQEMILETKKEGGRIFAVGTTVAKALEDASRSLFGNGQKPQALAKWSDLFIYPPYSFQAVDALITNFHLPKTTLLMLISAFADRAFILTAYAEAISKKYRFASYGDAMVIL
jgi:S-adenosylmethionine:tRNA ribosyltransferase-isomerase